MLSNEISQRSRSLVHLCVFVFLACVLSPGQQVDQETHPPPDSPQPSIAKRKGFLARWADFYRDD